MSSDFTKGHEDVISSLPTFRSIDHVALAVRDLDQAVLLFRDVLGFSLRKKRVIRGETTGMLSAEMEKDGLNFVLCQGMEERSQVSRLVSEFGPGVAHIAVCVDDVSKAAKELSQRGLGFDTGVIKGQGLTQTFTTRCQNTGLCLELISRAEGKEDFEEDNVQSLFEQLEQSGRF